MQKYIVVHSGKRDSYKVAEALLEANQLGYLVTDDYIFRYYTRKQNTIPLQFIKTSYKAVFWLLLYKITKKQFCQIYKDKALSLAAAKAANKLNYDLIAYSYYALPAFDLLAKNLKKILFQLHPQPNFVRKIFEEEIKLLPQAKKSLLQEHELNTNPNHFNQLNLESKKADLIFCASTFTKRSLEQEDLGSTIKVIPYGVSLLHFPFFSRDVKNNVLHVLFVGSLNQRKGIYYLLQAVQKLQKANLNIHLQIVGRGIFDNDLLKEFDLINCNVNYNLPFNQLLEAYKNADVFVFPSLCEGFAQVILEAMATGLPVIATSNTSAFDLVEEGKEGFVVPIRDADTIATKLKILLDNPQMRLKMGTFAHSKAKTYTWEKFKSEFIKNVTING